MYTQGFGQSGDDGTGGGGDIVDYPFYGPLTPAEQALQTVTGTPLTASQVAAAAAAGLLGSSASGGSGAPASSQTLTAWLNKNAKTIAIVGAVGLGGLLLLKTMK